MKDNTRVIIENVQPRVDCGRFPAKRVVGEKVFVTADIFADGHDALYANCLYRSEKESTFHSIPMEPGVNDIWRAEFTIEKSQPYVFTVEAGIDAYRSAVNALQKKHAAGSDIRIDLLDAAALLKIIAARSKGKDKQFLEKQAENAAGKDMEEAYMAAVQPETVEAAVKYPDPETVVRWEEPCTIQTEPRQALFSSWYEVFPRAAAALYGKDAHGTFRDVENILPEIARMGFDVLYLPPIHPIGRTNRKGKNNNPVGEKGDPGSPWAIGAKEGGHKAVHPKLGTLDDFRRLVERAREYGLNIALDIAFQCSPDHPYVQEHPEWFRIRADGSIMYAENPPKVYQDVYPFDFECKDRENLWRELKSVFIFWAEQGVRFFRVDNPHTKSLPFWEWVIAEVKREYPDAVFLAEAFTRPKVMYRLAKSGFTQSYTYFTWRNTKQELTSFMKELVERAPRDYYRPNFWPNTPDILPEYLQYGGRPAFIARLVLAATLSSNYGIYGPAFELCEHEALPNSEEYFHSEKYEIRQRNWEQHGNLKELIGLINEIRRNNTALQTTWNLLFLQADNDFVLFYAKYDDSMENVILVVVNLDPYNKQSVVLHLPEERFGIREGEPYLMHDLLGEDKFIWYGPRNTLELDPQVLPARIFRLKKRLKRETDFDYFF